MAQGSRRPSAATSADARGADGHVRFIYASLTIAIAGGLSLAVWLPLQAARGQMTVSWLAHAQVHGHLQVMGFAGLFVLGVATKLAPRFGAGELVWPRLVDGAFWCLLVGLLARTFGQVAAARGPFAVLMVAGACLELAGAVMFAISAMLTLRPGVRSGAPHALLMGAGMLWLVVQASLAVLWLVPLAIDGVSVLRSDRDAMLVTLEFYGFLLSVFAGVGLRSFPSFFGMPQASVRLGRTTFVLLQLGLLAWLVGGLLNVSGVAAYRVVAMGQSLVGMAVITLVSAFGWWRRETRFAAASQPLAWPLRATLAMLTLTGLLLCATGLEAVVRGVGVSIARSDALRHIFAIGVVTQGIIAMAQLILPEFASERLVRPPARWRSGALAAALVAALVLRALLPLAGVGGDTRYWLMTVGGTLALAVVTAFAVLFVRARRTHVAYLRRVAVWRAQALPTTDAPTSPRRDDTPPLR